METYIQRRAVQLGCELNQRRRDLGISQAEVSRRSGVSRTMINMIENGRTTNPTIGTLNKIAKALNAELALVIDLTEGNK